ncbi:hypothetical protein ASPSYDRAFT_136828 [Aspergillus sydowii CBS 593.65]|uniref:Uncharacterized protein n=1 Tax=Aspergillus sydowii CBS 593.65 TaxID=1036612 RepID=A0A1L9T1U1_9EURO|nr:uncharacterized protein ASPSYDRAFT_136828 [Aspergillus sydowii CBS 593.65]OJJ53311.1 hypothetical protein ASPSYDRAFT_136828 [Aspergillus sydowii CBS 593.65]
MAKLLDLPTELLLLILSHFDHFMYKYELQSLCISSKRLYSIAQPLLYRDFVREVNCQCCHKIGTPPGRIIPLVLFTRTLISRPDLASCVRSAAFDNSENVFDDEDVCEVEFGADTFKVLATGFHMPNLERLKLTIGEEGLYDLEPLFTQWHTNNPAQPYLRNLKSVVIRDLTLTESGSMVDLDYIQELPHLEEFTLINLNGDAEGCPLFEIQLETLNISSLSLLEACLDTESLTAIVDGCRCLKHFSYYGCNYDGNNIEESSQFDPSELTLRCNLDWEYIHPTRWSRCSKYGSFATFKNLIHIEIDQYPYTPKQELPKSLHCLTIRNISFSVFDTVGSLNMRTVDVPMYRLTNELPNLKFVTLQPRDGIPNGMLGIHSRYDYTKFYDNPSVLSKIAVACETLWDIVKECSFVVRIDHQVWMEFWLNY